MLAEVMEEAVGQTEAESVRIGGVEMALGETLQAIGGSALKQFLENSDSEQEAEIECACGGMLKYQRRRAATMWSVFRLTTSRITPRRQLEMPTDKASETDRLFRRRRADDRNRRPSEATDERTNQRQDPATSSGQGQPA